VATTTADKSLLHAFKDAAFWALVSLGLFVPLIGFRTVQNMRNELTLETRWPLLFAFVAIVAAGRLFQNLVNGAGSRRPSPPSRRTGVPGSRARSSPWPSASRWPTRRSRCGSRAAAR
jgi:branched-chain amino acid transport system permease protein